MVTTTSAVPLHPPSLAHPLVLSSLTISSPPHVAPSPLATLPISPAQVSSSHHLSSAQASRAQSSMFSATSTNNKTRISPSVPRHQKTLPNPVSAVTKATPSIQNLLATLKGQPIFDGQLKYLAKKFGLDQMSDGQSPIQSYGMIQRILGALHNVKPSVNDQHLTSPMKDKVRRANRTHIVNYLVQHLLALNIERITRNDN
ncbi:hypothetical protein KIN20_031641 [Parelaphostrongylus tenuis]|uniref:Uncharacterized protein n=1 Tax=Parelaphostrongylus tenuis TaxID=148309 RepID=A0AAD5WHE6_PARTN|nr:hypothetical protein KIN20_031641 [Parelaphostrongylus tenuis]